MFFSRCLFFGIRSAKIFKSCKDSKFKKIETIGEYSGVLEGLGVDWIGKNIFWANGQNHSIEVVNYSGRLSQTLDIIHRNESLVIENPRGLAVDSFQGNQTSITAQLFRVI